MKVLLILLFILSYSDGVYSQKPSYRSLTTIEGLAQNQVVAFLQDSQGFVWLGTKAGLSRFDGLKFRNFYKKDGLPDCFISTITECPKGIIYVLTRKGFAVYDGDGFIPYPYGDNVDFRKWRKSEMITTHLSGSKIFTHSSKENLIFEDGLYYSADSLYPDISNYSISSSWFSKDRKSLIFSDSHSLNLYQYIDGEVSLIRSGRQISGHFTSTPEGGVLVQLPDSVLLFSSELRLDSVFKFDADVMGFIYLVEKGCKRFYSRNQMNQILIIDKTGVIDVFDFNMPLITNVEKDKEGNLWILGERGALILQSEAFRNYTRLQGAPDYTWSIIEEPGKGIWLATYGQGLIFFDGKEFQKINVENLPTGGLKDAFYMGAVRDSQNRIWFPHSYGLVMVKDGKAVFQNQMPNEFTLYAYEEPLSGTLYFAQMNKLTILQKNGSYISHQVYPGNKRGIIVSITSDKTGNIWIGNAYGISIWDGSEFYKLSDKGINFDEGAVALKTDHFGNIWIGNKSGLYYYDYSGAIRKIEFDWDGHYVTDLELLDSTGLFIGLIGGMAYLDLVEFYEIKAIQIDYFNHLNGFLGMEVLQNGSFATDDGKVWVAASDRVILFDPEKRNILNDFHPNLIITNVSELNEDMEWKNIEFEHSEKNVLILPYYRNHIRFDFIGLTMLYPEKVQYTYRLLGLDENWSAPFHERYISFAYLPSGDYVFELNVKTQDGDWSENPGSLSFVIEKAWWNTWQAINIFFLIGLSLIIISIYWYLLKIKKGRLKKLTLEKQIAELKLEALKAQIDPHFIFNVLSSVGSSIYKGEKNEAYKNLTRFSKLIRQAFETNEKPYNSLKSEIHFVETYLELQQQRFKNAFTYEINISEEIDHNVSLPRLLIQTLVENAVKHGVAPSKETKNILVSVVRENNHLNLLVEDNGVGRSHIPDKNNGSTGRGINITRELFDIFNAYNNEKIRLEIIDLFHENGKPAGTRVEVVIPVNFDFKVFDGKTEKFK